MLFLFNMKLKGFKHFDILESMLFHNEEIKKEETNFKDISF